MDIVQQEALTCCVCGEAASGLIVCDSCGGSVCEQCMVEVRNLCVDCILEQDAPLCYCDRIPRYCICP